MTKPKPDQPKESVQIVSGNADDLIKIETEIMGITVFMTKKRDPKDPGYPAASYIMSALHQQLPENRHVPIVGDDAESKLEQYEAAVTALEEMILAHAEAGIDIKSADYIYGMEKAIDFILDNYDPKGKQVAPKPRQLGKT